MYLGIPEYVSIKNAHALKELELQNEIKGSQESVMAFEWNKGKGENIMRIPDRNNESKVPKKPEVAK